jgi:hypothetical protein
VLPPALAQSFQRYVKADLVAIFETIGNGFSGTVNLHGNALDELVLNPGIKGSTRETYDTEWRTVALGLPCFDIHSYPDLKRSLGSQPMKPERR